MVGAASAGPLLALAYAGRLPRELWLWKQEWLLFAVPLVTVAALTAIQWRSFLLGGRDYRILSLLPAGVARRVSSGGQAALLLALALLFLAEGSISRLAFAMRDSAHPVNWLVPVVWFRSLYMRLLGVGSATVAAQAQLAVVASMAAVAAAVPCSLLGFRDAFGDGERYGAGVVSSRLGARLAGRRARPVTRAVSSFVSAALLRSGSAALIARGLFLVGIALTLSGFIGIALRDMKYSAPVLPAQPLYAPAFMLPFFALVGLRLSAVYPAVPGANWIFRLTEVPGSTDYAAGVRRAALTTVVLPLLCLVAIPYAVLWGPLAAAAHVALALAVALVTAEWLFLGFPKIPFTCTYQPGKANLRVTWPKYFAIFAVYCGLLPSVSVRLQASPLAWAASVGLLLVVWRWLVRLRERQAGTGRLVFDDAAHPHLTLLGLEWRVGDGGDAQVTS